jgi:flagellar biogenesis protein FliO
VRSDKNFTLLVVAVLLAIYQPVRAQSKPSVDVGSVSAEDALERQPITPDSSGSASKSPASSAPSSTFDATRVLLALIAVVALIFVLMAAAKRIFPGAAPIRASSAVKVLARCPISPKQHLLVIQFGKRLVLVGDTGTNLNPLCEITDPEEAAGLLAQTRDESISAARRFDSFFGLARKGFAETPAPPDERFDDSHEIPAEDPSLEATRKELAGLSEKVRDVARQLGSA